MRATEGDQTTTRLRIFGEGLAIGKVGLSNDRSL